MSEDFDEGEVGGAVGALGLCMSMKESTSVFGDGGTSSIAVWFVIPRQTVLAICDCHEASSATPIVGDFLGTSLGTSSAE